MGGGEGEGEGEVVGNWGEGLWATRHAFKRFYVRIFCFDSVMALLM